jgi:F0F1-type ATP synthase assembly protein I
VTEPRRRASRERTPPPTPAKALWRDRYASSKALSSSVGTVGLEFALSIIIGFLGGHWLDGYFGTEPYLSIAGFGFGLAAGIRALLRAARVMRREAEREEELQGNPKPLYESGQERQARRREEREETGEDPPDSDREGKT